jgi:peptidoglycan/LPS O-acetylase OafA/YrhL
MPLIASKPGEWTQLTPAPFHQVGSVLGRHTQIPAFDGIRALAVMTVVANHAPLDTSVFLLGPLSVRGWYGVDAFFVLSGFLITWILVDELSATGTVNLKNFYLRRALRLQPAYASFLLSTFSIAIVSKGGILRPLLFALPLYLTYTLNIALAFGVDLVGPFGIAWSLCIEEQFYAMWSSTLRWLGKERALKFALALVATVCVYRTLLCLYLTRDITGDMPEQVFFRLYCGTDTRIDACMVGCSLALALAHPNIGAVLQRVALYPKFPLIAALTALTVVWWVTGAEPSGGYRAWTVGSTVSAIAIAGLILAVFAQPRCVIARFLSIGPLVLIGKVSYGIYLFHIAVMIVVFRLFHVHGGDIPVFRGVNITLVTLGVSVAVAWFHWEHVEKFFLALRPVRRSGDIDPVPAGQASARPA